MAVSGAESALAMVSCWAVGLVEGKPLVALQLNGQHPVLLSVAVAQEIAKALQEEADTLAGRERVGAKS